MEEHERLHNKGHLRGAVERSLELFLWKWMRTFQTRRIEQKQRGKKVWCAFQEYLDKNPQVCEVGENLENLLVFSQIVNTLEGHYS